MAAIDFLLQAVTSSNHAQAIRALFTIPRPTQVIVSVAFVREAGLDAVEAAIKSLDTKVKCFIGIRNDITSVQAVKRLLALNTELYAVDTGSRKTIFHPKVYFASSTDRAAAIIGSANLTFGGLHNNIEVSTFITLDLSVPPDKEFSDKLINSFDEMLKSHPRHVFLIKNEAHAIDLFESGRLADEEVIPAPSPSSSVKKGERDDLPPMRLNRTPRSTKKNIKKIKPASKEKPRKGAKALPSSSTATKYLVWESKPLSERDLNIPRGKNTAPTGSMGLKKGAFENIDHRHYFREEVFSGMEWKIDPNRPRWERSEAKFEIVIKNINYGTFTLKLSNNTDKTSRTYLQKNFMTQLHWGDVKKHIAKRDLLGRILLLYRKDTTPPEFTIEID